MEHHLRGLCHGPWLTDTELQVCGWRRPRGLIPFCIFHVGIRSLVFFQRHLPDFYLSLKSWEGATTDPATWSFLLLVHVFTETHFILGQKPNRVGNRQQWCDCDCSPVVTEPGLSQKSLPRVGLTPQSSLCSVWISSKELALSALDIGATPKSHTRKTCFPGLILPVRRRVFSVGPVVVRVRDQLLFLHFWVYVLFTRVWNS